MWHQIETLFSRKLKSSLISLNQIQICILLPFPVAQTNRYYIKASNKTYSPSYNIRSWIQNTANTLWKNLFLFMCLHHLKNNKLFCVKMNWKIPDDNLKSYHSNTHIVFRGGSFPWEHRVTYLHRKQGILSRQASFQLAPISVLSRLFLQHSKVLKKLMSLLTAFVGPFWENSEALKENYQRH